MSQQAKDAYRPMAAERRLTPFWLFASELIRLLASSLPHDVVAAQLWDEASIGEKSTWDVLDFLPEIEGENEIFTRNLTFQ